MQSPGLLSRVGNRFLLRALMFVPHLKCIHSPVLRFFFHRTSQEQTSIYWTLSFSIATSLSWSVLELKIHRKQHRLNLRHVCFPFFSRPVQTSHHPLKRQQDCVQTPACHQVAKLPTIFIIIFFPPITKLNNNPAVSNFGTRQTRLT